VVVLHSLLSCVEDDFKKKVTHLVESIFYVLRLLLFCKFVFSIFRKIINFRVNYTHYTA
jgi:hypothetical protein